MENAITSCEINNNKLSTTANWQSCLHKADSHSKLFPFSSFNLWQQLKYFGDGFWFQLKRFGRHKLLAQNFQYLLLLSEELPFDLIIEGFHLRKLGGPFIPNSCPAGTDEQASEAPEVG